MFLKRIELNGFKSFHNKKELQINSGITGVVGPNGSGKSNIADAIRWVLGEQSSKNLRGATMQDVIFNGTVERSRKGYCEVALIFDNADHRLPLDFTEIEVKRKMYRSGESEYTINNAACRLKDILELFRDTGIGKEGYSIIGQGRIDEILNSKPTARRKVFEEAAGIMKYRVRKEEAERNLQKTQENLVRLEDIIAELEIQISPLEKQMNEAREYLAMRDRLKALEVNLFLYQYDRSKERGVKLDEQVVEIEQEHEDATRQIQAFSVQGADSKKQLGEVQSKIEQHSLELGECSSEQERLKGKRNLIVEKRSGFVRQTEENTLRIEAYEGEISQNEAKIAGINGQIQEINTKLDEKYAQIVALREEVQSIAGAGDAAAENYEAARALLEEKRVDVQTLKLELGEAQVKLELATQSHEASQLELTRFEQSVEQFKTDVAQLEEDVQQREQQGELLRKQINEAAQDVFAANQKKQELTEQNAKLQIKLKESQSKQRLLSDLQEGYEGYFDSVRDLFRSSRKDANITSKIKGVLAEVISVPKEYETPVEIILGNALQNVVVDTDEDAKDIIAYLRKHNLGRVTFLPTQSLKVRLLQREEREHLSMDGVMCVASEAITCGEDVRPAVDFLLGRTVIVRDMDCAIALMRRADYAFRCVTMDGDFIKPGGVITGGSVRGNKTSLLARKRMLEELSGAIDQMERTLQKAVQEYDRLSAELAEKQRMQQALLAQLRDQEIGYAQQKQLLDARKETLADRDETFDVLKTSLLELQAEAARLTRTIEQSGSALETAQQAFDEAQQAYEQAEQSIARSNQESVQRRDALAAMEREQAEQNNQKNILSNDVQHIRQLIAAAREAQEGLRRQSETILAEEKNAAALQQETENQLAALQERIIRAGSAGESLFALREKLQREIEEHDGRLESLLQKKNDLIEQKYRVIASKEKNELYLDSMQNKIWEDYGLTYANALAMKEEFAFQASTREIEEIRGRMRDMGAVNPNAIEDFARVKERYDDLVIQRADLVKAGDDLQIVIRDLLTGMKQSFTQKFARINENFTRVFKELFGGGHAELELLDQDDVMECGIEIIAEPPGKKLQSITLLSGGEKAFTAIALLFAMLDINPSPICLLDEIDAPLDDANVVRFSEYLKKLSVELQFIVITHRKPSMAICDTLYGVAMHEKGVSDIVSVKLEGA